MRRIGLVLGAGGIVGQAYPPGGLQARAETGWNPASSEIVVGTSAGSLVGGLLRSGVSVSDLVSGRYRRGECPAVFGRAAASGRAATAERAVQAAARTGGRARLGSRIAGMVPPGRVSP